MNLEKLVAVSGLPGIHRISGNRGNGVILEDLDTGKMKFASMRRYQFTPLESIAIYTNEDSIELAKVFRNMLQQKEDNPPVSPTGSAESIKDYFEDIVPTYDKDQVHLSDMKKVIKWFTFLDERNLVTLEEPEVAAAEKSDEEEE